MATWYIIDGDLPFLEEFPQLYPIDDAPSVLWRIINGELPFKLAFPSMYDVNDAPLGLWRIKDGDLPYKAMFPKMYELSNSSIFINNENIVDIRIGDNPVSKIYLGDQEIYS